LTHRSRSVGRGAARLNFRFADDALGTRVLVCGIRFGGRPLLDGWYSDTQTATDSDFAPRSLDEPFYVVGVACENHGLWAKGYRHHNGVNDIRRSGPT
jgi:hypothetical protein